MGRAEAPAGAGGVPGWGSPPRLSVLCTPGTPGRGSFGFSVRNPRGFFLPSRYSHFPPMSWLLRCCQLPESHKSTGPFKFAKLEKNKGKKKNPKAAFFVNNMFGRRLSCSPGSSAVIAPVAQRLQWELEGAEKTWRLQEPSWATGAAKLPGPLGCELGQPPSRTRVPQNPPWLCVPWGGCAGGV